MHSLRFKIAVLIMISTLMASSIVGYFSIEKTKQMIQKEAYQKLSYYMQTETDELSSEMQQVMFSANYLASYVESTYPEKGNHDPMVMKNYIDQIAPVVETLAKQSPISQSAYVYFEPSKHTGVFDVWYADLNLNGEIKRQETFPLEYYNDDAKEKEWYYSPYNQGYASWTKPYLGTVEADRHIKYISYTVPVFYRDEVIGVTGSDYFFDRFSQKINAIKPYKESYAFMADQDFNVVLHPTFKTGENFATLENGIFAPVVEAVKGRKSGLVNYTWTDGRKKVLLFNQLDNGWYFILAAYHDEVYSDVLILRKYVWFFLIVSIGLSGFLGYALSRWVAQPLERLTHASMGISKGDYEIQIEPLYLNKKDEIGLLAHAIEEMRVRQKQSWDEMSVINSTLETRVTESTEQLIQTNTYLEVSLAQIEEQQAELTEVNQVLQDTIDSMRHTQKQLIETEKIAGLVYLVSGISHELNTPIGNGITLSSYVQNETTKMMNVANEGMIKRTELIEYLQAVKDSSVSIERNLSATRELILKFKALAAEKTESIPEYFIPKEYIDLTVNSLKTLSDSKKIQYSLASPPHLIVNGDASSFAQIVNQILTNSVVHGFHGREGGLISISLLVVESNLIMRFCDDGNGIDASDLQHIFVPFFSTRFGVQNKGLGLNITYNLVHKVFGGDIHVESEDGTGTCVEIMLPNCVVNEDAND